jgi:hypothetical protein
MFLLKVHNNNTIQKIDLKKKTKNAFVKQRLFKMSSSQRKNPRITEFLPRAGGRGGLAKIVQDMTFNKYPRYKST